MKNDKLRLIIIGLLTASLVAGIALFVFTMTSKQETNPSNLASMAIPLLLVVFAIFFIVKRSKDVKQGMPIEDERSKQLKNKAAATSFYFSLYWLLAISMFEDFFAKTLFNTQTLDASQTVGGGIMGMAVIFFISWLYYNKKGLHV